MPNPNINPEDVLGMSDEEFMSSPPVFSAEEKPKEEEEEKPPVDSPDENTGDLQNENEVVEEVSTTEEKLEKEEPTKTEVVADSVTENKTVETDKVETENKVVEQKSEDIDYKAAYDQIMAPFKANGKMIEIRSPEEAIQLMQMGANYTKKMHSIQAHRKVLMMLENNSLLDESKLSYLIDLSKNNPEAIKKLVKDAGIDPLDIDTSVEPTYVQGNHSVSDEESAFKSVLEELGSNQEGQETLRVINTEWDHASKESLWSDPELMNTIHAQRESGVYARICSEIDHQKFLGKIPTNVPFIQAYQVIGQHLHEQGAFAELTGKTVKQPIDRKVAAPKAKVINGAKASAASASRSTPNKAKAFVNPLSQSDDEFMEQFKNRV